MAGWMAYVDKLKEGGMKEAAIISTAGGAPWANSPGFECDAANMARMVKGFTQCEEIQACGINICKSKYLYLQSDDSQMQYKKGKGGVCVAKAKTCFLVGVYDDNLTPGQARKLVEDLRDYLVQSGY